MHITRKTSELTRSILTGVVVFTVTLTILLMVSAPVSADTCPAHGCKYDDGSIDPISYKFFIVTSEIETAVRDGAADWNSTAAPGYFAEQWWSLDPEIHVSDGEYAGTWWATTIFTDEGDGTYDGNEVEIKFDFGDMEDLTEYQKKLVAEHELGHAYGLDEHNVDHAHVMIQGEAKFAYSDNELPSAGDVAGVEAIY